ncbi:MAG: arylamine N-acetyltransferase family protein [Nitriliruptoraceae bacterium]
MAHPTDTAVVALSPTVVRAYLERIGHPPVEAPDEEALASLQDAHVRNVPFENLDIHLGRRLSLDLDRLVDKVVTKRRGGFCFELNGLFHALLASLGFDAWLVEARSLEDGELGPRFDHARVLVDLDVQVVVDVGTGASPRGPIELSDRPQTIGAVTYRTRKVNGRYLTEQRDGDTWTPGWTFDTAAHSLDDFAERCHYHQASPDSHFTHKPLCTLVTDDGHVTLSDRQLITTTGDGRTEVEVDDPLEVLERRFGISLPRWPGS